MRGRILNFVSFYCDFNDFLFKKTKQKSKNLKKSNIQNSTYIKFFVIFFCIQSNFMSLASITLKL